MSNRERASWIFAADRVRGRIDASVSYHGAISNYWQGSFVDHAWTCNHDHETRAEAVDCASAELERRHVAES